MARSRSRQISGQPTLRILIFSRSRCPPGRRATRCRARCLPGGAGGVMQDGVELLGQHGVDGGDIAIDRIAQRLHRPQAGAASAPTSASSASPASPARKSTTASSSARSRLPRNVPDRIASRDGRRERRSPPVRWSRPPRVRSRRWRRVVHGRRPPAPCSCPSAAAAGMRATMRSVVVSSSNCSHGRS